MVDVNPKDYEELVFEYSDSTQVKTIDKVR
jgi:hypothetical protein